MQRNDDLVCAMCGAEDIPGKACSILTLAAGFGSIHDLGWVKIPLCSECCDRLFAEMTRLFPAIIYDPWELEGRGTI